MRTVPPGAEVIDQFPAFELDGYTKRSGLTDLDFVVTIFRDGAVTTETATISEIGSLGDYRVSFSPPTEGFWRCQVYILFNHDYWVSDVVASESDITSAVAAIKLQVDKIDKTATIGPAAVGTGSLMDRLMNKDVSKTYNQSTDSLEAIRDRTG